MDNQNSSQKGSLLGRGRVAEVFTWADDLALKLFYEGSSSNSIEQEAHISRLVHKVGLATPVCRRCC